jgi:hypothetical protein
MGNASILAINPIYRFWICPSFWRRWPNFARIGIVLVSCAASLSAAAIPLFVWLPLKSWQGWDGLGAELIYFAFLILLSLFLMLAGSLTIAPERERQTWESLFITPLGIPALVRAKLVCRFARCALAILFVMPFWIAWGYEVLMVNQAGPAGVQDGLTSVRVAIFLGWFGVRTAGHILPCVALGMLISSFCRRGRAALTTACVTVVAYGLLTSTLLNLPSVHLSESISKLVLWPILNLDWQHYQPDHLVSTQWASDAIADTAWMIALPLVCYFLAIWRCRRHITVSS